MTVFDIRAEFNVLIIDTTLASLHASKDRRITGLSGITKLTLRKLLWIFTMKIAGYDAGSIRPHNTSNKHQDSNNCKSLTDDRVSRSVF